MKAAQSLVKNLGATILTYCVLTVAACSAPPSPPVHVPAPEYWPTAEWRTSTPESQGIDSRKLVDMLDGIREHGIPIHSVQVIRNGYVVLDAYFYPYNGHDTHDVASVTKSVTSTLIGLAVEKGFIASVSTPIVSLFPGRSIANRDAAKDAITVEHLLTMQPGLACEETPDEPTLREMRQKPDWVQFMLDRAMARRSGEKFVYCSPGMHLLSAALTKATRETALDFARQNLFDPLGIQDAAWAADPQGNNFGWGDLHLHPLDMAKLGFLYLHEGRWEARQVLREEWVRAATEAHARSFFRNPYGYGWWGFTGKRAGQYEAVGRGGQRITVIPKENVVVVFTGGGFEPGDVGDKLLQAIGPNQPLPANPEAVSQLAVAIGAATKPPLPRGVRALPETALHISGKRYQLTAIDLGLRTMELAFPSTTEGVLRVMFADGRMESGPIGLDAVPRISAQGRFGLPVALSGG